MFDPKSVKYPYPLDTSKHYLVVKKNDGVIFDKDYPYVNNDKKFLRKRRLYRLLLVCVVFPLAKIKLGLKIYGRKHLKEYKDVIKKGVISCSNHVAMWDYISVMKGIRPIKPYVIVWDKNINGENGKLARMVGGIPIPNTSMQASISFNRAVRKMVLEGGWLHIYSEGSMWENYAPIRPFKLGAAYFALKCDRPIIPLAFSYRKPSWIRKHIFKQEATLSLNIGTPLYIGKNLPDNEAKIDLTRRCHEEVCKLAGFSDGKSIYEPIYDENTSRRIDYYATEYGKNYFKKGN